MLETTLRVCLGWFCRNVKRVERVEESEHALAAKADPGRSDVRFGETHLQLAPGEHGSTLVRYSTSITPGFWIPTVVGRRWMLRTLEDATTRPVHERRDAGDGRKKKRPATELLAALFRESG